MKAPQGARPHLKTKIPGGCFRTASSWPGYIVSRAATAAAGPRLFGWALTTATVDSVIGCAHDPLEIFGAAMRASHFHGILAFHRQKLKYLIAFQALKLVNRHLKILDEQVDILLCVLINAQPAGPFYFWQKAMLIRRKPVSDGHLLRLSIQPCQATNAGVYLPASISRAWSSVFGVILTPPSIRAISSRRSSASRGSIVVRVRPRLTDFEIL